MKIKEQLKQSRSKNNKELLEDLKKEYEESRSLRLQAKTRELKDVNKIKKTKRKIAQILTILREKLAEENEKETARKSNQRQNG